MIGAKVDAEEEENIIVDVGSIKLEEESKVKYKLKDILGYCEEEVVS